MQAPADDPGSCSSRDVCLPCRGLIRRYLLVILLIASPFLLFRIATMVHLYLDAGPDNFHAVRLAVTVRLDTPESWRNPAPWPADLRTSVTLLAGAGVPPDQFLSLLRDVATHPEYEPECLASGPWLYLDSVENALDSPGQWYGAARGNLSPGEVWDYYRSMFLLCRPHPAGNERMRLIALERTARLAESGAPDLLEIGDVRTLLEALSFLEGLATGYQELSSTSVTMSNHLPWLRYSIRRGEKVSPILNHRTDLQYLVQYYREIHRVHFPGQGFILESHTPLSLFPAYTARYPQYYPLWQLCAPEAFYAWSTPGPSYHRLRLKALDRALGQLQILQFHLLLAASDPWT